MSLITCKKCGLQYVGNTVTSFRLRFNNHKSSMMRYGKEQRGMGGQKLYAHFLYAFLVVIRKRARAAARR